MSGEVELGNADVRWFLSVDRGDLPAEATEWGRTTFRSITIDGQEVEFSEGFTELHTEVYRRTLASSGFSIAEARPSVEFVHSIRAARK
jgi:UDP-N-acetyl-2-amino-2-deoxyglucuronate dehydrogenase